MVTPPCAAIPILRLCPAMVNPRQNRTPDTSLSFFETARASAPGSHNFQASSMRRLVLSLLVIAAAVFGTVWWRWRGQITSVSGWEIPEHSKVVCYRFTIPDEVESSFTLLKNKRLNESLLASRKVSSAELSPVQTQRLGAALVSSAERRPAACYSPHHIFVFYRSDGSVSGAAEVCFECTSVSTLPEMSESQRYHQDFLALARLVEELGLWQEGETVAEWQSLHDPDAP